MSVHDQLTNVPVLSTFVCSTIHIYRLFQFFLHVVIFPHTSLFYCILALLSVFSFRRFEVRDRGQKEVRQRSHRGHTEVRQSSVRCQTGVRKRSHRGHAEVRHSSDRGQTGVRQRSHRGETDLRQR